MFRSVFLFLLLFLISCHSDAPVSVGGIKVSASLRKTAREKQFDYTGLIARALDGEEQALNQMMTFSGQVDSLDATAHGQVLAALLDKLGDSTFSKIAAALPEENKRSVWAAIEKGGISLSKTAAPLTLNALFPSQDATEHKGLFTFQLNMSTFRDCAEPQALYLAIDETGNMERNYRRLLRLPYPGQPIFAEVKGYRADYFGDEKLPSKCAGFFIITEIIDLESKNYRNTCIPYDYWALGTEPFWQAQISGGEGLIEFRGMDDERTKVFTYVAPVEEDSARVYAAINQETGDNIRISVKREDCSDGMSEIRYHYKVEMTLNGKNLSGCGISFEEAGEKGEGSN